MTPQLWEDVGGAASIAASANTLVVNHTWRAHEKIRRVLAELRTTSSQASPVEREFTASLASDTRERRLLTRVVSFDFSETRLDEALRSVRATSPLPIVVDWRALSENVISADSPVTLRLSDVSLRSGLRHLLRDLDLGFTIVNGNLLITSHDRVEDHLRFRVYSIADLIDAHTEPQRAVEPQVESTPFADVQPQHAPFGGSDPVSFPSERLGGLGSDPGGGFSPESDPGENQEFGFDGFETDPVNDTLDAEVLREILMAEVKADSWDEVGGNASVEVSEGGTSLRVLLTPNAHDQIVEFLIAIRRIRRGDSSTVSLTVQSPRDATIEAQLRAGLQKKIRRLDLLEVELSRVAELLSRFAGVPIVIDTRQLDSVGLGTDTPITIDVNNLSVESLLHLILDDLELAYVLRDEVILITALEASEWQQSNRLYPVADLVTIDGRLKGKPAALIAQDLIDVLTFTISPTSWSDVGGAGAVECIPSVWALSVSQSEQVHQQVTRWLAILRRCRQLARAWKPGEPIRTIIDDRNERDRTIQHTLTLDGSALRFKETPLHEVVKAVGRQFGITVSLDNLALDTVGLGSDTPVTLDARGLTLGAALRHLLRPLELTYQVRNDLLLITTQEEVNANLHTWVYPVPDLTTSDFGAWRSRQGRDGDRDFQLDLVIKGDYDTLRELIMQAVEPAFWDEVGGHGSIAASRVANALVISQTKETHEQIVNLFQTLRLAHKMQHAGSDTREFLVGTQQEISISRTMQQPVVGLQFDGVGLKNAAAYLSRKYRIPIIVDARALDLVGVAADLRIDLSADGVSLGQALHIALAPHELAWTILDNSVVITSLEETALRQRFRVHLIRDLLADKQKEPKDTYFDYHSSLVESIVETVSPEDWDVNGGAGSIQILENIDAIVISQTEGLHQQVNRHLTKLRQEGWRSPIMKYPKGQGGGSQNPGGGFF